jgi:dynein heavy chain 1
MNFSEGSPYETLHAYVSNAVAPYFKSYIKETGKAERFAPPIHYIIITLAVS